MGWRFSPAYTTPRIIIEMETDHSGVRFAHVNLIAEDWRRLAEFYQTVFGCVPVPPERDQHGAWLERVIAEGGRTVGGLTEIEVEGAGRLTFQYVSDPEGNLIEIQAWS